nr:MAG TPA: hypothetical protein [Caudoviricetes sp.]
MNRRYSLTYIEIYRLTKNDVSITDARDRVCRIKTSLIAGNSLEP